MTNEEAISILNREIGNADKNIFSEVLTALGMAIKALEQDTVPFDFELYQAGLMCLPKDIVEVLDKIKAEIEDTGAYEQEVNGKTEFLKGINYCLSVIDKYTTEKECDKKNGLL